LAKKVNKRNLIPQL